MSASTVKGDRKREIGQSPIKKKFRDSTISREDIDEAIANGIKLAFKEQQSTLDSVVTSAVRDAVDSVLIPALRKLREDIQAANNSVKELREEFEAMAATAKQTRDRVYSVQATTREDRNAVTDLRNQLERLNDVSLLGGSLWAEVDRSRIITSFCCSIRPMFSVTCGLNCFLSIVVGHFCLCCFYFLQQIFMLLFTLPCF